MPRFPHGLHALNITQFLGAMNDNILKLLIIFSLIQLQGTEKAGIITASVGAAFALPFLLFSAPAGCLADRYSKRSVSVGVKQMEVVVTALAVVLFALQQTWGLYLLMFLMSAQSALFSPTKYGIIPELAPREELSHANGLIEAFTFFAIIIGTVLGPALTQAVSGRFWLAACFCLAISVIGLVAAQRLPDVPAIAPDRVIRLFPAEIFRTLRRVRHDHRLMLAIIGLAWFWLLGAFAQLNLISYGIQRLGYSGAQSGYLFLASAFGIAVGSLLAARLSGSGVSWGIVVLGGFGLTAASVLLQLVPGSSYPVIAVILLYGISAGLFSLPLQTFIQLQAEAEIRGEVLAASSFVNWIGILIASGLTFLFSGPLHLSAAQGFSLMGILNLLVVIVGIRLLSRIRIDGR